jgi:hypothetical protein
MPMVHVPPARRRYKGSMTDTDRWARVSLRPGDVLVCTPPKCGTTWTTIIVTMLQQGSPEAAPRDLVQWVDAEVVPLDEVARALDRQQGPRCMKSHTPFDGVPWSPDAFYIAVYRHPLDMLFSLRRHLENALDTPPDHPYLGPPEAALERFVTHEIDDFDFDCLATFVLHYRSFAARPRPDNALVLHYADMLADPRGTVAGISDFLGLERDAALIDAITEASSFGAMKARADRFAPFSDQGYWRDPQAFFDSAGTGKWTGDLDEAALIRYNQAIAAMLGPQELRWIEQGRQGVQT